MTDLKRMTDEEFASYRVMDEAGEMLWGFLQAERAEIERLQGELERFDSLYTAVNSMMNILGADGEISTRQNVARAVLVALNDIDGGVYRSPDVNPARVKEGKSNNEDKP